MEKKITEFLNGEKLSLDEINKLLPCKLIYAGENKISNNEPLQMAVDYLLTRREHEIVNLIRKGFNNREISLQLGISFETVKSHRKNIFRKLGINCVSELIHLKNSEYGQEKSD